MNWLELFYKNKIVFLFVAYLQLWVNFKVGQRLGWHMASKRARLSITYLLFCPNAENTAPSSRTHVINDGLSPVANKMPSRPLSDNIKIQCSDLFFFLSPVYCGYHEMKWSRIFMFKNWLFKILITKKDILDTVSIFPWYVKNILNL